MKNHQHCHQTLDAIWHLESGRITASVMRLVSDLTVAEELVQDAMLTALERWRADGIPDNPAAWLMTAAKNRAIDHLRRHSRYSDIRDEIQADILQQANIDSTLTMADEAIDDDVLRLMFIACHPLLSADARIALTLRLVNGLSVAEIARAFLVPEATIAQRITRAKRTLKAARIRFEDPAPEERQERLGTLLGAIYLIYNEGYTASSGKRWMRPTLCDEALRLARSLASLAPDDTEALGLAALLEFQTSRLKAREDSEGNAVLLTDQNRGLWEPLLIRRGFAYLDTVFGSQKQIGVYCLQAAIAACHARASTWEQTDWDEILALYDALLQAQPTAVVALNRAVAVSMVDGPGEALKLVEEICRQGELSSYHLLYAIRGDLLQKSGRFDEAQADFLRAAELTGNEKEKDLMQFRATECVNEKNLKM